MSVTRCRQPSAARRAAGPGRAGVLAAMALSVVLFASGRPTAAAEERPTVDALSWMTGTWVGPAGADRTLEENWVTPRGGSIGALVRITTADTTPTVELVVIEELLGTLVLHIQQWDPRFTPRPEGPQTLTLAELGDRRVRFQGEGDGSMKSLTYSSADPQTLTVDIEMTDGRTITLPLKAR